MLSIQKKLSFPFLAILGLPATAVGFSLSTQIAALSWLLSTRFGLDIHSVALVWLAGPLAGIIGQPIVGVISDRVWFLGGRRKGFIMVGGVLGALMFLALPQVGVISSAMGFEGVIVVATVVALLLDLSINVTFNPARSIIADLTPEGEKRTSGFAIMQLFSGTFGLLAYFMSIVLGNMTLLSIAVVLVFLFSVVPCLFIEESRDIEDEASEDNPANQKTSVGDVFRIIYPLSGFLLFALYLIIDKLILGGALESHQVVITVVCAGISLVLGVFVIGQGFRKSSNLNEFHKIMVAHSFSWLGIQSMFVMSFFFATEVLVPNINEQGSVANGFSNIMRFEKKADIEQLAKYVYELTEDEADAVIASQEDYSALVQTLKMETLYGANSSSIIEAIKSTTVADFAGLYEEITGASSAHDAHEQAASLGELTVEEWVAKIVEAKDAMADAASVEAYSDLSTKESIVAKLISDATAERTAGNITSLAFLLFNFIGAFFPVLILQPLSKHFGRVRVYSTSILIMSLAYLSIWLLGKTEYTFYAGICAAGIGWAAVISIVFAIMSERVDKKRMGLNMGLFNYSVVLPQMMTVGVAAFIRDSGDYAGLYLLCGLSLAISFLFWLFVKEPETSN
jgi:MFS family permease